MDTKRHKWKRKFAGRPHLLLKKRPPVVHAFSQTNAYSTGSTTDAMVTVAGRKAGPSDFGGWKRLRSIYS